MLSRIKDLPIHIQVVNSRSIAWREDFLNSNIYDKTVSTKFWLSKIQENFLGHGSDKKMSEMGAV